MQKKVDFFLNGKAVSAITGSTIMQACLSNGVEIPRFCYHDQLSIAGNCRMCLVEIEKAPKLVASCAMPISAGVRIQTETSIVRRAREGVLEFLLINHPLDCPICDQGGECDLQDQAMVYGSDRGRFYEFKRSVKDKQVGPLIKTIMTRCIHCTRCVRFASEIAALPELGTAGRGGNMEITTYIKKLWLDSNISGNVIDLCPVGALTSKPYAFKARPWELRSVETIDTLDAFGSAIRVDSNGFEIVRILPKFHKEINGEWISDKARYSYDGFKKQRLLKPLLRNKTDKTFAPISWSKAIQLILSKLKTMPFYSYIGDTVDLESLHVMKYIHELIGSMNMFSKIQFHSPATRKEYLFQDDFQELALKDSVLVLNSSLELESPLLRLRYKSNVPFYTFGEANLKLLKKNGKHFGMSICTLSNLLKGKHPIIKNLLKHKNLSVVQGVATIGENSIINNIIEQLNFFFQKKKCNISRSFLHMDASQVGALEIGFLNHGYNNISFCMQKKAAEKFVYLLGIDDFNTHQYRKLQQSNQFIVYQGSHGDLGAQLADLIIPGVTPFEKEGTYINMQGRIQKTTIISQKVGSSEIDSIFLSKILMGLFVESSISLNSKGSAVLLNKIVQNALSNAFPSLKETFLIVDSQNAYTNVGSPSCVGLHVKKSHIENYYETNAFVRASETMTKCALLKRMSNLRNFI